MNDIWDMPSFDFYYAIKILPSLRNRHAIIPSFPSFLFFFLSIFFLWVKKRIWREGCQYRKVGNVISLSLTQRFVKIKTFQPSQATYLPSQASDHPSWASYLPSQISEPLCFTGLCPLWGSPRSQTSFLVSNRPSQSLSQSKPLILHNHQANI